MIAVLRATLASLDESVMLLSENSAKLRAAQSVDINQLIEQLNKAAESARVVRELVLSELPDASWQSREELDGSVEKIHNILETRAAVEASRSRLLAIAAALERGTIVHRRAQRLLELNHLREEAINELRSQAASDTAPAELPGPQADEWVAWACTLKEPEDAESLRAMGVGYPYLDDLIANLEPNMWTPGLASSEVPPQSEKPASGVQEETRVPTNEQRVSERGASGTGSFYSLSPRFSPQPASDRDLTKEKLQRTKSREVEALTRMMGVSVETVNWWEGRSLSNAHSPRLAALLDANASPTTEPDDSPFPYELYGLSVLGGLATEEDHATNPRIEETEEAVESPEERNRELAPHPITVADETVHPSASSHEPAVATIIPESHKPLPHVSEPRGVKPWTADGRLLLAAALVLLLAAALIGWKWYAARAGNRPTAAINAPAPELRQGAPENKAAPENRSSDQPIAAVPDVKTGPSGSNRQTERPAGSLDKATERSSSSKLPERKSANQHEATVLTPPAQTPRPITKEESPPPNAAEMQRSANTGSSSKLPSSVTSLVTNSPGSMPKLAPAKDTDASALEPSVLLRQVPPRYPMQARMARIQGAVVLQGIIGKDGTLHDLQVVSGDSSLIPAALEAAKQWLYKPSYLHGQPVEAETQIKVNFSLGGG